MLQGDGYIRDIVEIGGRALEYEDRFILGCTTVNSHLYDDEGPRGLLRMANERYYQFVIARALMSRYEYHVAIEKETYDFVISVKAGENKWLAVGEIKKWFSSNEELELPGMRNDIKKLRTSGHSAFFLVATFWPPEDRKRCLGVLTSGLELEHANLVHDYGFRTIGWSPDTERDFALVGFRVR